MQGGEFANICLHSWLSFTTLQWGGMSLQEYYLVALAQQRPDIDSPGVAKSAISTAMGLLVPHTTTWTCRYVMHGH